jgi:hypothetical protein
MTAKPLPKGKSLMRRQDVEAAMPLEQQTWPNEKTHA